MWDMLFEYKLNKRNEQQHKIIDKQIRIGLFRFEEPYLKSIIL